MSFHFLEFQMILFYNSDNQSLSFKQEHLLYYFNEILLGSLFRYSWAVRTELKVEHQRTFLICKVFQTN